MTNFRHFIFYKTPFLGIEFWPAIITAFLFTDFFSACSLAPEKKQSVLVWSKDFPTVGSLSSPRTADLNNDGILDIVIGAGKNEFQKTDMGILAFDGKSGNLLWKQNSIDQIFGSATFCDITGDKVKDIIIGGRSPQLKAIDGKSGALIWDYNHELYKSDSIMHY